MSTVGSMVSITSMMFQNVNKHNNLFSSTVTLHNAVIVRKPRRYVLLWIKTQVMCVFVFTEDFAKKAGGFFTKFSM